MVKLIIESESLVPEKTLKINPGKKPPVKIVHPAADGQMSS